MLKINERVRPCKDRLTRSSLGRVTVIALVLSSNCTCMSAAGEKASLPLGPSTPTLPSATCTLTFAGMTTGCLPMRAIGIVRRTPATGRGSAQGLQKTHLPHGAEDLAPGFLLAGLPVPQDASTGPEDGDSQAIQHSA